MQTSTDSLLDTIGNLYLLSKDKTPAIVDYLSKQALQNFLTNSANQWQSYGITAGDTVALLSHNHLLYLPLLLSAVQQGITIVPVNWHLTVNEIEFVVHDCKAKRVITDQDDLTNLSQIPCIAIDDFFTNTHQLIDKIAGHSNNSVGSIMLYTSGTTGKPKGVVRAGADNWPEQIKQWQRLGHNLGLTGQGRHLVTGPLYHAAPLFFALFDWLNGADVYLMPSWNPLACLNALQELQITHTHCVPTMFNGLLNEATQRQLPYLQCVLHGAGPISQQTKQQMLNWWGDCLVEYWGGSESGTLTIATAKQWRQHPNTVGKPLAGYEVFAVNDEGKKLAPNNEGLLFAKKPTQGNQRAFEYFNDPQKTDAVFNKDGAFTLGDIGYVNEKGFVFLANRRGDLIISGGANIYPAEVEQALCDIAEVDDAAVFPVNDDYWGQRPWALVVLNKNSDTDASHLKQQLKTTLASYKVPDCFIFTDSIPRSDAGKLYRRYLTKQYQA